MSDHPTGRPRLAFLHLSGGGCGGCGLELDAIRTADWDRIGLTRVASPRHADLLLVSGCVTRNLRGAVASCWAAMGAPRYLVTIGGCARDGGMFAGYAVEGGLDGRLPVTLAIPGCPPAPEIVLEGLRELAEAISGRPGALPLDPAQGGALRIQSIPEAADPQGPPPAAPPRRRADGDGS